MMLAVVALVTWSATSVASAMPVSTTWNETNTLILGSNAGIHSSYTDSSEERTEPLVDILTEFHAFLASRFSSETRQAKVTALDAKIEDIEKKFKGLFLDTPHDNVLESEHFLDWVKFVRQSYDGLSKGVADESIHKILLHHFNSDRFTLVRALVGLLLNSKTKQKTADDLLKVLYKAWETDTTIDFKKMKLDKIKDPISNSPLYLEWSNSMYLGCKNDEDKDLVTNVIIHVMAENCKGDNLVWALVKGSKDSTTTGFAKGRLNKLLKELAGNNESEDKVFTLLQLNTDENDD